jgi:type VI secretion system ImpM family protein
MAAEPFLFGKLPSHGDFVARGVAQPAQTAWDEWASAEITHARKALADKFEAAHDQAPPFRFISGPGPLGEGWRAGAAAASIDSAGRRFVVMMGVEGLAGNEAAALGVALADRSESAIRRALIDNLQADQAIEALAEALPDLSELALCDVVQAAIPAGGVWWRIGEQAIDKGAAPPIGLLTRALQAATEDGWGSE